MPDPSDSMPWLSAWIEAERKLLGQSAMTPAGDYVGLAGDWWRMFGAATAQPAPDLESLRAPLIDRYRQLFTPAFAVTPVAPDPLRDGAATIRWQAATRRFGEQVAAVAGDAFRRLALALASDDLTLPPITSLRELHELWIECGEAAYAAAAHGDEFAEAQGELLAAWVELCALRGRPQS